jgi:signal transduction histidine kinase/ActR/RegA family two-component response regulator
MRLSTRLILLILLCLLPVMAAQVFSQVALYRQRQAELGQLALRQAELSNGDLASIVEGARQLAVAIADYPEMRAGGAACDARLAALQRALPAYRFLAVYDPAGRLACASSAALAAAPSPFQVPDAATGFAVGRYTSEPGLGGPVLPISLRPPAQQGRPPLVVVAGFDLDWLSQHLSALTLGQAPAAGGTLVLADSGGAVLARFPPGDSPAGDRLPPAIAARVTGPAPSVATQPGADGQPRLVAVVPATVPPLGLAAIESLPLAELAAGAQAATLRDIGLLAAGLGLALALASLAARRFIYRPAQALLSAAQRWRDGDLAARAAIADPHAEFGVLAQSFNAMASSLQSRDLERRLHVELLNAEVAERTRALAESNNRLQVEIAEREKTEAALHQAQKLQAVGQLAGGVAHDFNNMLATILGSLELMERRVADGAGSAGPADAERLRKLIERATGAVQRGAHLTSRLLAFSRRQRLSSRPTDLNLLITELVTLAGSTLGSRIRVTTALAAELWPAMIDPSQIESAILNLCLNARDAMRDGGQLSISTENAVLESRTLPDDPEPGAFVQVTVADTGEGMSPAVLGRAFEPFFTTKGTGGSGLGLSQVHGIVRQSGGAVRVASTPGQGTQVTLLLPRAAAPAAASPAPRAAPGGGGNGDSDATATLVLVVDDDQPVRQVTVEMLKDLGCAPLEAGDAAAALALLDDTARLPELVLLDYAMPGMNGLQLAQALRARGLTVPIALVTGYAELADSEANPAALDALLRKPFSIGELDALLRRLRLRDRLGSEVLQLPGAV